jgi:hypothetical protein
MMFMRASSKVQQDKSKDLAVSVESIKAQLSGLGFRDQYCHESQPTAVIILFDSDERQLSQRLQKQLNEVTMELQQRALDFELAGSGAEEQRRQHDATELAALRSCNNDLLAELRALQKEASAKDFLLAAQKAAAASAAAKSCASIEDMKQQV